MTISEPNERWAESGRAACAELQALFHAIEHVGSTAVPGLAAKPVIDLMASGCFATICASIRRPGTGTRHSSGN